MKVVDRTVFLAIGHDFSLRYTLNYSKIYLYCDFKRPKRDLQKKYITTICYHKSIRHN